MGVRAWLGKLTAITGVANDYGLWVGRGVLGTGTNTTIDDDGLSVTQAGIERVRVGDISGGAGTSFGINIKNSSGNALIDGNQIQLTGNTAGSISGSQLSGGTVPAGVALGISQTTVTSSGVKVTTGGVDRVVLGAIGGSDYGLKVVNAGSTVIIDGTSDMFRIIASGTFSLTGCNSTGTSCTATTNVTLSTGLTTVPAHLGSMDAGDSSSRMLPRVSVFSDRTISDEYAFNTKVTGVNQTLVTLNWITRGTLDRSGTTLTFKYQILEQTAF